jgi:hypothetical protein
MADIEAIKARIRKLMAVTGDMVATEGEINNAMSLAMKLIDQHQIDIADIKEKEQAPENIEFGQVSINYTKARIVTWESTLGMAICKLFGSVSMYASQVKEPFRINGIIQMDDNNNPLYTPTMKFYGPINEINEAKELYTDWLISIGTMACSRWGGCYRGAGAQYCDGFTRAIYKKVSELDNNRSFTQAKAPAQFGNNCTAITLTRRYELIKKGASEWLKKTHNIKLNKGTRSSGYQRDNSGAFSEGFSHGSKSNFSRKESGLKQLN